MIRFVLDEIHIPRPFLHLAGSKNLMPFLAGPSHPGPLHLGRTRGHSGLPTRSCMGFRSPRLFGPDRGVRIGLLSLRVVDVQERSAGGRRARSTRLTERAQPPPRDRFNHTNPEAPDSNSALPYYTRARPDTQTRTRIATAGKACTSCYGTYLPTVIGVLRFVRLTHHPTRLQDPASTANLVGCLSPGPAIHAESRPRDSRKATLT